MNASNEDPAFIPFTGYENQTGREDISAPSNQSYIIPLFLSFTFLILLLHKLWAVCSDRSNFLDLPVLNLANGDFSTASREWSANYEYYMKEGYKKYRHSAYQLWGPDGYVVVLSPDFLQELKYEKDEVCDFYSAAANAVQGKVKFLNMTGRVPVHALRSRLTPKLDSLMPAIHEELNYAVCREFPDCSDWTNITIGHILGRVVGRITGRLFFGPSLARDEDWLQTIIDYPENVFAAARKLRQLPSYLRPLALPFLKNIRRALYIHYKARKTLVPIMEARRASQLDGSEKPPEDFLQWVMEGSAREDNPTSFGRQAEQHMVIMLAAIHTSTIAGTHMMFDLATMPHLIEPLRQEINEIWNSCGGALSKPSLRKMVKLDSFMKESQRINPPTYSTFDRIMTSPKTLSNGLHLPKGTIITIPSSQVSMDQDIWHDPETFNAFRFSNLRANSNGNANNFQYPTPTEQSLHFGIGMFSSYHFLLSRIC
ncbi:cytochrome P450 [Rhexocercosporidium sp. MPI-PUGE-AT-0058]|nr:cytochrome P450 [Rhexocercosporidium sp. MPI-PUGE-AT-0058]